MKCLWVLMLTVVGAGLGSVVHAADPSDGRVLRYTVLSNGHVAGSGEDSYRADGVIDSRYEYNDRGRGYSTTEHGRTKAEGFYLGNNSPPSELALLAAALIKAKGAPIALLPAGEARLERVTDATVHSSSEKRHVTEYAITGLSFDPQTVWLDEENRFFGSPGKWYAALRYGFEAANDELYSLQQRAEDCRLGELVPSLALLP